MSFQNKAGDKTVGDIFNKEDFDTINAQFAKSYEQGVNQLGLRLRKAGVDATEIIKSFEDVKSPGAQESIAKNFSQEFNQKRNESITGSGTGKDISECHTHKKESYF